MSYSNKSTAITAGLTLVAAFAIGGYILGHQLGEETGKKDAHTQKYERHAADEIKRTCLSLDPTAEAECVVRVINTAHEHKRAESDLIAQKSMARWALLMLIVTAAMAVVTAFGVYYVWRTLVATQDMADDTRDIGEKQVKAYVSTHIAFLDLSVKGAEISPGVSVGAQLALTFRNSGNSPARNLAAEIYFVYPNGASTMPVKTLARDLAPGENYSPKIHTPVTKADIVQNSGAKEGGGIRVFLQFSFVDVFGQKVAEEHRFFGGYVFASNFERITFVSANQLEGFDNFPK
jgi:hypothetical protein